MRHKLFTGTCAALGLATATVLGAQTTTTQPQTQQPSATAAPSAEKTITVTGCLRPAASSTASASPSGAAGTAGATGTAGTTAGTTGTTGTAGTSGTAGAAGAAAGTAEASAADAAQQKFILEDAAVSPADAGTASTATAAAPSSTAPAQSGQKETYNLVANGSALSPHVGKKLELTGVLEANSQTPSETTSGANAGRPTLRVQSGKIVAASCDQK